MALVQTFRFHVSLVRSAGLGPTLTPPPALAATAASTAAAPPPTARPTSVPPPDQLGDGGFSECSGLELDTDVHEYLEGGRNDGVVRRVGRVKLAPLVLKRGMFTAGAGLLTTGAGGYADTELWDWLHGMVEGVLPLPRYDGTVEVLDAAMANVTARWTFTAGLPLKLSGPSLNAMTGEIAIEELHLAHEGLRLEPGT